MNRSCFLKFFYPTLIAATVLNPAAAEITTPPGIIGRGANAPRIATVDIKALYEGSEGSKELSRQINSDRAQIQKDQNERRVAIQALDKELMSLRKQVEDPSVSASKKQAIAAKWEPMQQERIALERNLNEYVQRRSRALQEKMMQRMKLILTGIREVVDAHAKQEGYDYVLEKTGASSSQVPFILYSKDAADITAEILEKMKDASPAAKNDGTPAGSGLDGSR